jgi:hypothetical protein
VGGAAILTSLSTLEREERPSSSANGVHVAPLLAPDEERRPIAGASLRF